MPHHPTDPLTAVREGARFVAERARFVAIREEAIAVLAARLAAGEWPPVAWDDTHHFRDGGPATAQYLLVLDALNFCFWPDGAWDYNRLALALKRTMEAEPGRFDAAALAQASEADVCAMLGGGAAIPLLAQRVALLREVGAVLAARWDGQAASLVAAAQQSASALVALVTAEFPAFRDHAIFAGHFIPFYKRAQIFVGDLWGSFGGEGLGCFHDVEQLTMFADYRVPQLLRAEGVLDYSSQLATLVDLCRELPSGSHLELEIRAASIHAVEQLRAALAAQGHHTTALELDWLLWNLGEQQQRRLPPHHRTLTIFY